MNDVETFSELYGRFVANARSQIEGLGAEALAWQPDPGGNSIGVTVWHFARWMDILGARIMQDLPAEHEQWHTQGWADRTGYDPRGIGSRGFGAVTGYTLEEVAAIPALSAEELLTYLDQGFAVVRAQLSRLSSQALQEEKPGQGVEGTLFDWLVRLTAGFFGHLGEVAALKAMRERTLVSQHT